MYQVSPLYLPPHPMMLLHQFLTMLWSNFFNPIVQGMGFLLAVSDAFFELKSRIETGTDVMTHSLMNTPVVGV